MATEMHVTGIEEMISRLKQMGARAGRVENRALRAGAQVLQETMARNAPGPSEKQRPVHLKDNILMSDIKKRQDEKVIEVGPGKESFYARFLEFGTSKMEPHPFVEPSIHESKDEVLQAMADEIRSGIGL